MAIEATRSTALLARTASRVESFGDSVVWTECSVDASFTRKILMLDAYTMEILKSISYPSGRLNFVDCGGDSQVLWATYLYPDFGSPTIQIGEIDTDDGSIIRQDTSPAVQGNAGAGGGCGGTQTVIYVADAGNTSAKDIFELDVDDFSVVRSVAQPDQGFTAIECGGIGGNKQRCWYAKPGSGGTRDDFYELDPTDDFSVVHSEPSGGIEPVGFGGSLDAAFVLDTLGDDFYRLDPDDFSVIATNSPPAGGVAIGGMGG